MLDWSSFFLVGFVLLYGFVILSFLSIYIYISQGEKKKKKERKRSGIELNFGSHFQEAGHFLYGFF